MCSGWTTEGNSTTLGSGKSRTMPRKSSRDCRSSLIAKPPSVLVEERCRIRPALRGRLQHDFGQALGVDFRLGSGEERLKAGLHLTQELLNVQPQKRRRTAFQVAAAGVIELDGAVEVAVAVMA